MFAARLATAIALLALFCAGALLLPNVYWGAVLLAGLLVAAYEWGALAGYERSARWLFIGVVIISGAGLLLHPRAALLQAPLYWVSVAFWVAIAPVWLIRRWRPASALVLGAAGWIVLVPAWLAVTALQNAAAELLILLAIVWIADTAAYIVGRRIGRHRMAPHISPGKTWEGLMGAALAVAVYYSLLWLIPGAERTLLDVVSGLMLFGAVTAMSVQGDLFESWMKRQAGVKDSGALLPGHGGVLDRIDGLTAAMPLAALWIHYFGASGIL